MRAFLFAQSVAVACVVGCATHDALAQMFPAQRIVVGAQAKGVGIADMDEDGRLDFVDAGAGGFPLAICLHRDDGSFAPQTGANTGAMVPQLLLADLNGDGHVDGAKPYLGGFSLAFGTGTGSSVVGPVFATAHNLTDVAGGDFDGDGDIDLVDVDATAAALDVRKNAGAGAFALPTTVAVGVAPSGLAVADLDADGALDVITANATANTITAVRGNGVGAFASPAAFATGAQPVDVAIADIDLDGALDALTANAGAGTVSLLRGNGAGGFLAPQAFAAGLSAKSLVVCDFDLDGRPDVAAGTLVQPVTSPTFEIAVLRGSQPTTFAPAFFVAPGQNRTSLAAGDLTCDGYPDLAFNGGAISGMVENDRAGGFLEGNAVAVSHSVGPFPWFVHAVRGGDLDQDGDVDVLHLSEYGAEWLANDGSGALAAPTPLSGCAINATLGDVDNDGDLDLVDGMQSVRVALNDGTGGFVAPISVASFLGPPNTVWVEDVNTDGTLDLAVTYSYLFASGVATDVAIVTNNGSMHFTTSATKNLGGVSIPGGAPPPKPGTDLVVLRDVTGDGKIDVIASAWDGGDLVLIRGNGAGGLTTMQVVGPITAPGGIIARDLNADGIDDIAACSRQLDTIEVYRGLGTGSFAAPFSVHAALYGHDLAAADFDGDGNLDLSVGSYADESLSILRGDGAMHFERFAFGVPQRPYSVAVLDLDADPRPDLVVWSDVIPNRLTVLRNTTNAHPWTCLGHGLAGAGGAPRLEATGTLVTASAGSLMLEHAPPNQVAVLFVANQSQPVALLGATLIPFPVFVAAPFATDAQGRIDLAWSSWPPLASGAQLWFQYAIADSTAPAGAAFSNALLATAP